MKKLLHSALALLTAMLLSVTAFADLLDPWAPRRPTPMPPEFAFPVRSPWPAPGPAPLPAPTPVPEPADPTVLPVLLLAVALIAAAVLVSTVLRRRRSR